MHLLLGRACCRQERHSKQHHRSLHANL
jgi:hypothetical protein